MNLIFSAITLGFLGSFHCVGMCGPIALALPLKRDSISSKISGAILYNVGRIITYALLGLLFGFVGQSFVIAGYQQALSISVGVAILVMVLFSSKISGKLKTTAFIYSLIGQLKQRLSSLFKKNSYSSLFLIGSLNGLLPCGLVYLGIAGAIATGNGLQGSLFMAVFGLGTLPAMLTLALVGNAISVNFRNKINKAIPVFVVGMALLLILRGMNLGIPYISPEMSATKPVCHKCCKE